MSDSLDPDQAGHSDGPNLCPICLQRLSAEDKSSKDMNEKLLAATVSPDKTIKSDNGR